MSDAKIQILHFADPWCFWSWGIEPLLQRLRAVYGHDLEVIYGMGGMADDFRDWQVTYGVDDDGTIDWIRKAGSSTGNPCNPRYMVDAGLRSTTRSCRAVKAAERQDRHKAERYFRRLMERFQLEAEPDDDATLLAAARDVGLDPEALVADLDTPAIADAFRDDKALMQRSRANFLSLVVTVGKRTVARSGLFHAAPYEKLIAKFAPDVPRRKPDDILAYLAGLSGHLVHTREVSEVFQIPDDDAEKRLRDLHAAGLVGKKSFDFADYWLPGPETATDDPPASARL
jgi:predicted DsbA family dithiol-disulfide isomerase